MRRLLAALVLVLFALAGCDRGYPSESSQFASGSTPSLQSVTSVEATFVQQLLVGQQAAVALASTALEPARGAAPRVQSLAREIAAGDNRQIAQMSQLLRQWQVPSPAPPATTQVQSLTALSGAEFDQAWIAAMVSNRQQGVTAAQAAQQDSDNPQVRDLAATTIRTQNAQISAMQALQ